MVEVPTVTLKFGTSPFGEGTVESTCTPPPANSTTSHSALAGGLFGSKAVNGVWLNEAATSSSSIAPTDTTDS